MKRYQLSFAQNSYRSALFCRVDVVKFGDRCGPMRADAVARLERYSMAFLYLTQFHICLRLLLTAASSFRICNW